MKWINMVIAVLFIMTCFFPWVIIPSKQIVISGMHAEGTTYGKPAYLNMVLIIIYVALALVSRLWAQRINIFVATINLAWCFRNFILLARCEGGECPERQTAFYLYFVLSFVLLLITLLVPQQKKTD